MDLIHLQYRIADDNQIDFVVWPESSEYQDGFDITQTDLNVLTQPPFGIYGGYNNRRAWCVL